MSLNSSLRRTCWILLGTTLGFLAAPVDRASALDKVVYGVASKVGLANASMYLAQGMGFFREENIDIQTVQFEGTAVLLPQLANKTVTIGYPIPDFVIISHDTGKDPLPVKYFYNVTRVYNWEIIVLKDSPIKELKDLRGKKVGVNSLSTGNVPTTRSMLKEAGLEVGRDVELIATPQGAAAINALKTGRVDALNLFDVFHSEIDAAGTPIRRIPLPPKYLELFGNSFAAHVDAFRDNPDLLKRFGRAYAKGLVACYSNPEGCVRNYWKMFPSMKPTQGTDAKNMADSVKILNDNLRKKIPDGWPAKKEFGYFPPQAWKTNLQILADQGIVKNRDMKLEELYTNEFVPDFGRFNVDEIVARAKALP